MLHSLNTGCEGGTEGGQVNDPTERERQSVRLQRLGSP